MPQVVKRLSPGALAEAVAQGWVVQWYSLSRALPWALLGEDTRARLRVAFESEPHQCVNLALRMPQVRPAFVPCCLFVVCSLLLLLSLLLSLLLLFLLRRCCCCCC
jgi:hypothetical protein